MFVFYASEKLSTLLRQVIHTEIHITINRYVSEGDVQRLNAEPIAVVIKHEQERHVASSCIPTYIKLPR